MLYFYGDPHFGDDAIRRYENRPFNNTKTMDIALITDYNEIIKDDDIVIFTGDLGAEGYEKDIGKSKRTKIPNKRQSRYKIQCNVS